MVVGHLRDVIDSVRHMPIAAAVIDLETRRVLSYNEKAASLFGSSPEELLGTDVLSLVRPDDRDAAQVASAALASKALDGYQVRRELVTPSGQSILLHLWNRRVEVDGRLLGLWFFASASELEDRTQVPSDRLDLVLVMTDHDWQIEYMSADASLLGVKGSELRGFPLLGLIHPSVAGDFLAAAGRAAGRSLGVTVETRMRLGGNGWADRCCFVSHMCDHQPPRLGVVISAGPSVLGTPGGGEFEAETRYCALEARASETLRALTSLTGLSSGSELSARQTEIVSRLIAGETVAQIARSMFLSPSTVRNHLSAIYRKFAVHSQAELLASLLRAEASFDRAAEPASSSVAGSA